MKDSGLPETLDFSALQQSRLDMRLSRTIKLVLGGFGAVLVALVILPTLFFGGDILQLLVGLVSVGFLLGCVVIFSRVAAQTSVNRPTEKTAQQLVLFAHANKLELLFHVPDPVYAGMLFRQESRKRELSELLILTDGTHIGNYRYIGIDNKEHLQGFVRILLQRKLPHMVLDAKANNLFSDLAIPYDASQRLELEGNFHEFFTLYAPKQYESDAFYLLTPDIMQALITYGAQFDFEIVDDELYIYPESRAPLETTAFYDDIMALLAAMQMKIRRNSRSYSDAHTSAVAENVVMPQGSRLHGAPRWGGIIVGIVAAAACLYLSYITLGKSIAP